MRYRTRIRATAFWIPFRLRLTETDFRLPVGDSITAGAGVGGDRRAALSGRSSGTGRDEGAGAQFRRQGRSLLSTSRWPYREEGYYQMSLAVSADLYILMLGSNDIWQGELGRRDLPA